MSFKGVESSRAFLIVGDDHELVYKALVEIQDAVEAQVGSDFERIVFQGGECSVQDVVGSLVQGFIFASRALIVLRDPSGLSTEDVATLILALESYQGDNFLILVNFTGTVDSKLRSFFSAKGSLIDPSLKNRGDKSTFLAETVHDSGLSFDPDAFQLLSRTLGEDVSRAISLVDLLKASVGASAHIDVATLELYLPSAGDVAPWDLTDAIEGGRVEDSLDMLDRLMHAGNRHPLVVVAMLQRRFVELALVSGEGIRTPSQALAVLRERDKKFSRPEFVIKKMVASARHLGYSRLAQAFIWLSLADRQIKGEGGLPPELAAELLVARLAKSFSNNP